MKTKKKTFLIISHSHLLRIKHFSDQMCTDNQNIIFMSNNGFFFENRAVCEIMWKNIVERDSHRGQYGARVLMLDIQVYKYTLRICNIYCFATTTLVARTSLSVALQVRYIACLVLLIVSLFLPTETK